MILIICTFIAVVLLNIRHIPKVSENVGDACWVMGMFLLYILFFIVLLRGISMQC